MYKHGSDLKLLDEGSIFISESVVIGDGVTVYENNRIEGECVIGDGAVIYPGNFLKDTVVGRGATVDASRTESAVIGDGATVGPYARLRPGAHIMAGAHIGNFVEVKNATVGRGTKIGHLAYVGDADIGADCNIGCGAIFVNYNGRAKNRTAVGDRSFIGSNCNIIAPVKIAGNSYIAAGTTVTEDVAEGDFVIGRARQTSKPERAEKYLGKGGKE